MHSFCFGLTLKVAFIGLVSFSYAKSPAHLSLLKDIDEFNVLVTYYSTQCPFSRQFLKLWNNMNLQSLPTVGGGFVTHLIDCKEETELCIEQKVKYYPSIRFHQPGSRQPLVYRGRRTTSALLSFLGKAMLGSTVDTTEAKANSINYDAVSSPPAVVDGGVIDLTDANFDSVTAGGPVFVKFYTDWCPHCQLLKPLFPQLATAAKQLGVALGQVNCETQTDTCSKHAVPHYPYMALYAHGRRLAVHETENSVEEWVQFLKLKLSQLLADRAAAASEGVLHSWYSIVRPVHLTSSSFDETAKSTEFLFVKFYAPW